MGARFRWGLIGCGSIADVKVAPALNREERSELSAVMARQDDRAKAFAEKHGAARHCTRIEDLLSQPIDAVYIATPPNVHAEYAVAAAKAGKHVLCEKPMALTTSECDRMIRAAEESRRHLMVAYYRRRYPVVMKMKEWIDQGRLGRVTKIRSENAFYYAPAGEGGDPWRVNPAVAGGGIFWDIGSHRIDLMIHLMGDVSEVGSFLDTQTFDISVEDSAVLILRFAGGGQGVGMFHWNVREGGDEMEIGGTDGRMVCDLSNGRLRLWTRAGLEELSPAHPPNPHLELVKDFLDAVEKDGINCCTGTEGRKTNLVLDAAGQSSQEKRIVRIQA